MAVLARRERIALPSELAVASGSRLDPKSLQREERDHLVLGLTLRRPWHTIVITPRSASIQVLFLKVVFVFGFRPASSPRRAWWRAVRSRHYVSRATAAARRVCGRRRRRHVSFPLRCRCRRVAGRIRAMHRLP